jgi:hypothetical protein
MVEAAMVVVAEREREGGRRVGVVTVAGWRETLTKGREWERENREEWRMREIRTGVLHEGDKTGVGGAAPRATWFWFFSAWDRQP